MSPKRVTKLPPLKEILSQVPYLPKIIKLVLAVAKGWILLWGICLIMLGFMPGWIALISRNLINSVTQSMAAGNPDLKTITGQGLLFVVVFVGNEILNRVLAWARLNQSELIKDHLTYLVHKQSVRLDMYYYDSPKYYDLLHRTRVDAINRPVVILENIGNLIRYLITFITLAIIIAGYAFWLPIVIVFGAIPSFLIVYFHTKNYYQWRIKNTHQERLQNYYDWVLTLRDAAEEMRLFGLGEYFQSAFQTIRTKLRNENLLLQRNKLIGEIIAVFISLLITGFVLFWIVMQALNGLASLGDLALFYQVFNQGQLIVRSSMTAVSDLLGNLMYLEDLFQFLALEPKLQFNPNKSPKIISDQINYEFKAVDFYYPDSNKPALKKFNLIIPQSKITAIVGENGAGKSTLLKLMCRFYDPTQGEILINGTDIRNYNPEDIYRQTTILFQSPVRYHTTANDNIRFGDLSINSNGDEIKKAAELAGSDKIIQNLPRGYQTILGKWFGGAELSGGEWQRLALARAFLRQAPVIILDEPTSAMDSWAEIDWFKRFRQLAKGKTSVVITHRFTTAMQADIIHVMQDGEIIESGSHHELLSINGFYAKSWSAQMREAEKQGEGIQLG